MRPLVILGLLSLIGLIGMATPSETQQINPDSQSEQAFREARQVAAELSDKVRSLLLRELDKKDIANAVKVCSEIAQGITRQLSVKTGYSVRRVSMRYRNPKNIPDEYERRKLKEFDVLNRDKRLKNEYAEVVKEQGKDYLRYMKPLIAFPLCINCHGAKENIAPEVKVILADKYPDDRATGFKVGDVRGAISIKMTLSPKDNR